MRSLSRVAREVHAGPPSLSYAQADAKLRWALPNAETKRHEAKANKTIRAAPDEASDGRARSGEVGGLAQLARALDLHSRGHRFDSDILHADQFLISDSGFLNREKRRGMTKEVTK